MMAPRQLSLAKTGTENLMRQVAQPSWKIPEASPGGPALATQNGHAESQPLPPHQLLQVLALNPQASPPGPGRRSPREGATPVGEARAAEGGPAGVSPGSPGAPREPPPSQPLQTSRSARPQALTAVEASAGDLARALQLAAEALAHVLTWWRGESRLPCLCS